MPTQTEAVQSLIAAVEKSIHELEGKQGPEFESIRNRLKETYVKLQGLLAMVNNETQNGS